MGSSRVSCRRGRCRWVSGLLLGETASFEMVRVVGQVDLGVMIDTAFHFGFLLLTQGGEQGRHPFLVALG